jgi:hypothetical protein
VEPELLAGAGISKFRLRLRVSLSTVVNKNQNSYCIGSSMWIRLIFFHKKQEKSTF